MRLHFVEPLDKYREFISRPTAFFRKEKTDVGVARCLVDYIVIAYAAYFLMDILNVAILYGTVNPVDSVLAGFSAVLPYFSRLVVFSMVSSAIALALGSRTKFKTHLYVVLFSSFVFQVLLLVPFLLVASTLGFLLSLSSRYAVAGIGVFLTFLTYVYATVGFTAIHKFSNLKAAAVTVVAFIVTLVIGAFLL